MEWLVILVPTAGLAAWLFLGRGGMLVSESDARKFASAGAVIIDVRTEQEFKQKHLGKAVNIPLAELPQKITSKVPSKDTVVLLHCAAGGRSAMARRKLREMGYQKSYNLGSYNRASRLVEDVPGPDTTA